MQADIESNILSFFIDPQTHRDFQDSENDDAGYGRPSDHGNCACQLGNEIAVASSAQRCGRKERQEQNTEHTADTVDGENVKTIVNFQFHADEIHGKITDETACETHEQSPARAENARSGCDGGEACNRARGRADEGWFTALQGFNRYPDEGGRGRSNMGDQ